MKTDELYTTDGKDVWLFTGEEEQKITVALMKNLQTGRIEKTQDVSNFKRLVIDGRFKQPTPIKSPRPRKEKATLETEAIKLSSTAKISPCLSCCLYSNCDQVANLKPDGTCESYSAKNKS